MKKGLVIFSICMCLCGCGMIPAQQEAAPASKPSEVVVIETIKQVSKETQAEAQIKEKKRRHTWILVITVAASMWLVPIVLCKIRKF